METISIELTQLLKDPGILASLLKEGKEFIIKNESNDCARVTPFRDSERIAGLTRGAVTYISDDFDESLGDTFAVNEPK